MLLTFAALVIVAVGVHLLWRLIVRVVWAAIGLAVLAALVRGVLLVEPRMAELDLVAPALIGILFGAVVIAAGWGLIWNSFVDDQARDTIDKARAVQKAKRLW